MWLPIVRWGCALANAVQCVFRTDHQRFPFAGIVALAKQFDCPELARTIAVTDPLYASAGIARTSSVGTRLLPPHLLV